MRFAVAFYEIDRHYGGPEEGGLWYDTAAFRRLVALTRTETSAEAKASRANRLLEQLQRRNRKAGSLLYVGGRHRALIRDGLPPCGCRSSDRPSRELKRAASRRAHIGSTPQT